MLLQDDRKAEFARLVVEWYRKHGRHDLPWRRTRDPWQTLLACMLLRKTTSKQVAKVFPGIVARFPKPEALAQAPEDEIKRLIAPLGMEHKRAKLLKELAQQIVERFGGAIPSKLEELKSLPGVGDYSAREVLCVAFSKPEPMLDRNMLRIISRVFGLKLRERRPHEDKSVWEFAKSLVPQDADLAREFNYGVLDLANKVCTVRNPKCGECLVRHLCYYASSTGDLNNSQKRVSYYF